MAKYTFEEDKDELLKEMLEAVKAKPKPKKEEVDPNRPTWLKVEVGDSFDFRIVKVQSDQTFYMAKQHYLAGVNIDGVVIPEKCSYAPCTQNAKCIGCQIHSYIKEAKSHTEFKSEENQKLFKMMGSCEPSDTLFVLGIDRRDSKLKIFQAPKLVGQAFLEKAMSKKYGNPAHPKKGYDWKLVRTAKNKWDVSPYDDSLPLTDAEIKMLQDSTFTWEFIRNKFSQEAQDKLGVKFGTKDTPKVNEPASEPARPVEVPSEVVVDHDDDIPF